MNIKRKITLLLAVIMAVSLSAAPLSASAAARTIAVYVDGKILETDTAPQIINDRTMVPMRAIFEAMGMGVNWNEELKVITADDEMNVITLEIGSREIVKNGKTYTADVAPVIKNSRTLVPLRAIAETLGAGVYWSAMDRTVLIDSTGNENPEIMAGNEFINNMSEGQMIADFACRYVGVGRYVYGGKNLDTGVDCSGFIYAVYKEFGYTLTGSSSGLRSYGVEVSYDEMEPGDIICYSGHVSMYIGDGRIVHARNEKLGICITDDPAYREILTIRRIV